MDDFQKWRAAMIDKIGAYWDAAYREGKTGACESDTANSILHGEGGIEEMMQAHQAALAELRLYRALCDGYTLEELQRMSLTFKAQIDVLRARPAVESEPFWHAVISPRSPVVNRAIRSFDNAVEYAGKCLANDYLEVEVVPLYRLAKEPQK